MDTRKIQKVGGSTFTVSLPKQWASENGVDAGTEVCLHTHIDGSLVVRRSPGETSRLERAVLDVEGDRPDTVTRALAAAYAAGFETVELRTDRSFEADQRRAVTEATRRLVGTEVVETAGDRIAVRTLLDASEVSIRQSVVQLNFVARSMHRTATAALVGDRAPDPDRLYERDDEVDRLFEMVARHFGRSLTDLSEVDRLGVTRRELLAYRDAARHLERVADNAVGIARVADGLPEPPAELAPELRTVGEEARETVEDATAVLLSDAPVERAHDALDGYDRVRERVRHLEGALCGDRPGDPPAGSPLLARALGHVERTAANGANVARTAIQAEARSGTHGSSFDTSVEE